MTIESLSVKFFISRVLLHSNERGFEPFVTVETGVRGLAQVVLKLSALQIRPVDHFKNYILQFYMKDLKERYMI